MRRYSITRDRGDLTIARTWVTHHSNIWEIQIRFTGQAIFHHTQASHTRARIMSRKECSRGAVRESRDNTGIWRNQGSQEIPDRETGRWRSLWFLRIHRLRKFLYHHINGEILSIVWADNAIGQHILQLGRQLTSKNPQDRLSNLNSVSENRSINFNAFNRTSKTLKNAQNLFFIINSKNLWSR